MTHPQQTYPSSQTIRKKYRLRFLAHWGLAIVLALVLFVNFNDMLTQINRAILPITVYGLLTMIAVIVSVPLTYGRLSTAHAIGMLGFLSLDASFFPVLLWTIFVSSLLGEIIWHTINRVVSHNQLKLAYYRAVLFTTARTTLSFFVAGTFYLVINAPLPIDTISRDILLSNVIPLLSYALIYLSTYFIIFALQIDAENMMNGQTFRGNIVTINIILFVPVPFAIVAAGIARVDVSPIFFVLTAVGAVLIMVGLYMMARSEQRLRRQVNEMQSIETATQKMRGTLSMEDLLTIAYQQIVSLIPLDGFVTAIRHTSTKEITYPLVMIDGVQHDAYTLPMDQLLIAHIFQTGKPLLLNGQLQEKLRPLNIELPAEAQDLKSWLGVPIIVGETRSGVFILQSRHANKRFDKNDLRLVTVIAANASVAIENTRLYYEQAARTEQLATLNQIAALLTGSLSPSEVLDTIVSSASMISDAQGIAVYLNDENKPMAAPKLQGLAGFTEKTIAHIQHPIIPTAPNEDRLLAPPRYLTDISIVNMRPATRQALMAEGFRSMIELPLIIGHDELGVIALYYEQAQAFDVIQIDLLQAYTTQAAQAIANAYSYTDIDQALERRVGQLYSLATLGRMVNATMDEAQIHTTVIEFAMSGTQSDHSALMFLDEDETLVTQAATDHDVFAWQDHDRLQLVLDAIKANEQAVIRIDDAEQVSASDKIMRKILTLVSQESVRSILIMPMLRAKTLQGILWLQSATPNQYKDSDVQYISQVAHQAMIAIDNTQLFQRIRENRDNLQIILNAMEEAILLIDHNHHIAMVNPRISLLGLQDTQILNKPVKHVMNDTALHFCQRTGFSTERLEHLLSQINHKQKWLDEPIQQYTVTREGGAMFYIQRQTIPLPDENGKIVGALLVFYNKTEEYELARARDSFSQMIVHDLRSPLTAVTTSMRLIAELVPADVERRDLIDKTIVNSNRAVRKVLNRVNALLDIAKIESGEMQLDQEPTAILPILHNVINELNPLALELNINIELDAVDPLPYLYVDADKTERMLLNLVDNALKYSPMNSTIQITIHAPEALLADAPNFLRVDVLDEGAGIPDDYKLRLFDRFVQIDGRRASRHGVGLGLTFCKLVAESHGGRIWVKDNQQGGSIFSVELPIISIAAMEEE